MTAQVLPHDVTGTGAAKVLVLHGWFGDRTSFDSIRGYLDPDRFSYAFVDYRGYGQALAEPGDHTVSEAAADVLATADALGWQQFSLVGHSMGGLVAQHVLTLDVQRVRAIAGISPVPATGISFDEQGWELFSGARDELKNRRAIIDFTTGSRLPACWLDEMVQRSVSRSDETAFGRYLESWAASGTDSTVREQIQGSGLPVLVIAGAHDPALSPHFMNDTWLAWYPNAELVVFNDAGHYAPDEAPLLLVSELERFLGR